MAHKKTTLINHMCFSAPISVLMYIIGTLGCARLALLGFKIEAIFYAVVVHMQLIEALLWLSQRCDNPRVAHRNKLLTAVGTIINHMEPIALWTAISWLSCRRLPAFVHVYMIVFCAYTIVFTTKAFSDKCTIVSDESRPHLHWAWNYERGHAMYYPMFVIALCLLSVWGLKQGGTQALIVASSFLWSFALYRTTKSVGAMWCFVAALVPWLLPEIIEQ